jgi:hypothetical protein
MPAEQTPHQWFQEHRDELEKEYPGLWIAVKTPAPYTVVATASSAVKAAKAAITAGYPNPAIFKLKAAA